MNKTSVDVLAYLKEKAGKYFHITKTDLFAFLWTFACGFVVHLYMFTHKFINHDDVGGTFDDGAFGFMSGRWLLKTATRIGGSFSSPWFCGVLGILFISITVVFMVRLFHVKRFLPIGLIGFIVVSFPTVAATFNYMFTAYQYFFAMMLSSIGAWFIREKKLPGFIAGVLLITLSMGCYQAYYGLAAALLVFGLILDICEGKYTELRDFLKNAVTYVAALALVMVLYFAATKISLWITGITLTDYMGISDMGKASLREYAMRILRAYYHFVKFYINRDYFTALPILPLACLAFDAFAVLAIVINRKIYREKVWMLFLLLLLGVVPFACNIIYFMVGEGVHLLMIFPMVLPLIIPAVAADKLELPADLDTTKVSMLLRRGTVVLTAVILLVQGCLGYEFAKLTNRNYFNMYLSHESANAYFIKMTQRIEAFPGFSKETPVAIVNNGHLDNDKYLTQLGITGSFLGSDAVNIYSQREYLLLYLGSSYHYISESDKLALRDTDTFKNMPCYPDDGSIAMIDGVIVVKCGETEETDG